VLFFLDRAPSHGLVLAGSQVKIGKVGIGVWVRKGAPKPDISSLEAFKRALMTAKAIGYLDPADGHPAAIHLVGAFERLGMTADLKPKTKLAATGAALFDALVKGDTDIAFSQSNADDARIELVGMPPGALANTTVFTVAIVASSKEQEGGKALIAYLSAPAAAAVFKAKHVGRD
jgi:molybdate transport system substrate-binding protein